ncbi:hypothetical protein M5689_018301 [Euphorbia peplus]|nr:hypothetical protein M5689_018301 [Euphorbia peplus]
MQGNSFQGAIPSSLSSNRGLQHFDLSRNNLTGEIPKDLQNLPFLQYLNLSLNRLEGEVPTGGVFSNATALSLIGNAKLCGGIPQLLLPKCPSKPMKKGKSDALKIAIIVTTNFVLLGVLLLLTFLDAYRSMEEIEKVFFISYTLTDGSPCQGILSGSS